jgi:hypothetical protein
MATKAQLAALAEIQADQKRPNSGNSGLQKTSSVALSGKKIQLPSGESVPIEFYDWVKNQQETFLEVKAVVRQEAADESLALQYSKGLGDELAAVATRLMALERDSADKDVVIAKSDALVEAESQAARTVVAMASTTSDGNALIRRIDRAKEDFNRDMEARFAEGKEQASALVGTVKANAEVIGERSNIAITAIANSELRQQRLDVQQQENSDGIKSNRDTLRAFTGYDLEAAIDGKVSQSFDNQLQPAMEELIARKYVTTAPTTGLDGYDPKRDDSAKPFLTEQVGDDATARAVNRALKKGRRA